MFTRLIASRPLVGPERRGLTFSVLFHGSVFAAAVLLTASTPSVDLMPAPPRIVPVQPYTAPSPPPQTAVAPAPPAPVAPQAPALPVPVAPPISMPVLAPTTVPSTIPEPGSVPWAAPAPGATAPGGAAGDPAGTGEGLGTSSAFAETEVDQPAALHARSPLPRYPDALRAWRTEGVATARFVVDTLGRVEREGAVVEASHPAFAAAVRAALPRMRFRPARIGARPVRQLVEFPITFRLDP